MQMLSPKEENDLVSAIEQSIGLTHSGLSPNEAIIKVASSKKYGPEKISRMVEAFNKSKSVHVFKSASQEDRAQPFDIADTQEILRSMYAPSSKEASQAFELPPISFADTATECLSSGDDKETSRACMDKRASLEEFNRTADLFLNNKDQGGELSAETQETCNRLLKQACKEQEAVTNKLREEIRMRVQFHKLAFERALDDVCEYMAPLTPRGLRKVGQYIVNGYPTTGKGLLDIIEHKSRVTFPEMSKTANCVTFPTQEPYVSINKLYTAAEKMAKAEVELEIFIDKQAASGEFGSNFAANALANFLAGAGVSSDKIVDAMSARKRVKSLEEEMLDADSFNTMRGQEAKRTFILLSLYHPELKNYSHADLLKAYNSAVSSVPEAYNKPEVLSNLMAKNLESSGLKDPFELKQEADISEMLRKREQSEAAEVQARKDRLKDMEPAPPTPVSAPLGIGNIVRSAEGLAESGIKTVADWGSGGDKKSGGKPTNQKTPHHIP